MWKFLLNSAGVVYRKLSSRKTALAAIVIFSLFLLLSLIIPQRGEYSAAEFSHILNVRPLFYGAAHRIGLTDIYRSIPMQAAFWLFYLNLLFIIGKRISNIRNEISVKLPMITLGLIERAAHRKIIITSNLIQADVRRVASVLQRRRFHLVTNEPDGYGRAVKNRFSVIGSLLFHGSVFLFVIAAQVHGLTRIDGTVNLGEGEVFTGERLQYSSLKPVYVGDDDLPKMNFRIESIEHKFDEDGVAVDEVINIADLLQPGRTWELRRNVPFYSNGASARIRFIEWAPVFELYDPVNNYRSTIAFRLILNPPGAEDKLHFRGREEIFQISLFPNFSGTPNNPDSINLEPLNPVASIGLIDKETGEIVESTFVKLGERARINNMELSFIDLIKWARLDIEYDKSDYLMIVALTLLAIGVCWRLLLPKKRIDFLIEQTDAGAVIHLGGNAEFSDSFIKKDFDRISSTLEKELG